MRYVRPRDEPTDTPSFTQTCTDNSNSSGIENIMGSHFSRTDNGTTQARADKGCCGKNAEQKIEQHASTPPTAPTFYQLDSEPRAQLVTEASIWIGPCDLTFELAQRIAQDLPNSKSSPAIAELKSRSKKLGLG
jgi:hypothetical protein